MRPCGAAWLPLGQEGALCLDLEARAPLGSGQSVEQAGVGTHSGDLTFSEGRMLTGSRTSPCGMSGRRRGGGSGQNMVRTGRSGQGGGRGDAGQWLTRHAGRSPYSALLGEKARGLLLAVLTTSWGARGPLQSATCCPDTWGVMGCRLLRSQGGSFPGSPPTVAVAVGRGLFAGASRSRASVG